ncbi:MAG: hypothetical protein ACJASX_003417 [Limisphaerales bacterium]|jgi:hypothetical protein
MKTKFPKKLRTGAFDAKVCRVKHRDTERFQLVYYDLQGRRQRPSFKSVEAAEAAWHGLASDMSQGKRDAVVMSETDRLIFLRAKAALAGIDVPLDLAVIQYVQATRKLGDTPLIVAVDSFSRSGQGKFAPIAGQVGNTNVPYTEGTHFIKYNLDSHGFFSKPSTWSGRRVSPGNLQAAIAAFIATHNEVGQAINVQANQKYQIDRMMDIDESSMRTHDHVRGDFDVHSTNRVTAEQTLDPNQLRGPRKLSCSSGFRREWFAHGSHWGPIPPLIRTSPIFGNNPLCPEKPSKHRRLFKCSFRTVASS